MKTKNFHDHFEDLYLRHDYIKMAKQLNGAYYEEFKHIIKITASIMYKKHMPEFQKVGFVEDDLKSVAGVYALTFMELYSLRNKEEQMERFVAVFRRKHGTDPLEDDIFRAEKNHMINFLRQKLSYCATLCNRKSRNIIGGRDRTMFFAFTENSIDVRIFDIIGNHTKLGYRKITAKEYKLSLKRAKELGESQLVDEKGFKIFRVDRVSRGITKEEYTNLLENERSLELKNPEVIMMELEEASILEEYKDRYAKLTLQEKRKILMRFIDKNKSKKAYRKQVSLARKKLKDKDFMV